MKNFVSIMLGVMLSGCAQLGHKEFYSQVAPSKFPPTSEVNVFEYRNVDLDEIYELLFSDFLIIGKSSFNGPYEDPGRAKSYAKSIGADILVASSQFSETRTSFMSLSTPTTSTTSFSGYSGSGSVYGTATTYGTQTTTIPVRVNRYDQDGIYLKNINDVTPLWNRTIKQYEKTESNELDGTWQNESYKIEIFQSGQQIVAFISDVLGDRPDWSKDQLKFVFGEGSNVGIYLMGNKTPVPSEFEVNKFGHLEVKLLTNSETFSFAKMP
jgi:hypothetical protein